MLRKINNKEFWLAIISHNRPHNIKKMTDLVGSATWYVSKGEQYLEAPAIIESGGLLTSRNRALRDAFDRGLPCVQFSDDLSRIRIPILGVTKKPRRHDVTFEDFMTDVLRSDSRFKLVGVTPTDNPLNYRGVETQLNRFILGDFIMVRPCELFFDENLKLKEDYDYTLQHITAGTGTLRFNRYLLTFGHRTNQGGAVDYRTPEKELEAIAYLKNKWGKFISLNPQREHEILLNLRQ